MVPVLAVSMDQTMFLITWCSEFTTPRKQYLFQCLLPLIGSVYSALVVTGGQDKTILVHSLEEGVDGKVVAVL